MADNEVTLKASELHDLRLGEQVEYEQRVYWRRRAEELRGEINLMLPVVTAARRYRHDVFASDRVADITHLLEAVHVFEGSRTDDNS